MRHILVLALLLITANVYAQHDLQMDAQGKKLRQFYLSMNVEQLWQAGQHVNWETGKPDQPDAEHDIKTHCSSFAASACKQLDIYLLRPPEHKQGLLANAQYDWLMSDAAKEKGWKRISGQEAYAKAQQYADEGFVVTAVCQNPDEHKPGHVALVMPANITAQAIAEAGPKVIMAGQHNYNSVTLREGFKYHIKVWPTSAVKFYYNEHLPHLN